MHFDRHLRFDVQLQGKRKTSLKILNLFYIILSYLLYYIIFDESKEECFIFLFNVFIVPHPCTII